MGTYQLHTILGLPAGQSQLERLKADGKVDPSKCTACGKCTEKCPQHLPVSDRMERLAETLKKL
jgi:predicted aldo/keto reductase-like oxidoreductase